MIRIWTEVVRDPENLTSHKIRFHADYTDEFKENVVKMMPMVCENLGLTPEQVIEALHEELRAATERAMNHVTETFK